MVREIRHGDDFGPAEEAGKHFKFAVKTAVPGQLFEEKPPP
jgi:hypothetical protein